MEMQSLLLVQCSNNDIQMDKEFERMCRQTIECNANKPNLPSGEQQQLQTTTPHKHGHESQLTYFKPLGWTSIVLSETHAVLITQFFHDALEVELGSMS